MSELVLTPAPTPVQLSAVREERVVDDLLGAAGGADEVRQGLHEKKKTTAAKKPRKSTTNTDEGSNLFE